MIVEPRIASASPTGLASSTVRIGPPRRITARSGSPAPPADHAPSVGATAGANAGIIELPSTPRTSAATPGQVATHICLEHLLRESVCQGPTKIPCTGLHNLTSRE